MISISKKKILLVQPKYHTRYPPLGLLKISTFHKQAGNITQLVYGITPIDFKPDEVYITSLYTFAWKPVHKAVKYYIKQFPNADVKLGGIYASLMPDHAETSGAYVSNGILPEVEELKPDYSLVPNWDGSIIFSSRGCSNKCPFCAVPQLEGNITQTIKSIFPFIEETHTRIIFWDNNFLDSPGKTDIILELSTLNKKIDFNQGLDASLIDDKIAHMLASLKIPLIRMAYDSLQEKSVVQRAIRLLVENGIRPRDIILYMLYNYNDGPEDLMYRIQDAMDHDVVSYPMRYQPLDSLKKNSYINNKWTQIELDMISRARRIMGYAGALPPYSKLKEKILNASSFEDAFEVWPLNWRDTASIVNNTSLTQISTRKRTSRFGNTINEKFIDEISGGKIA